MRYLLALALLLDVRLGAAQGARDDESCQVIGETTLPDGSSHKWEEDFWTPRTTSSVSPGQTKTVDYFHQLEGVCTVNANRDDSSQMSLVMYPPAHAIGTMTIGDATVSFSDGECFHFRDYTTTRDPRPIRISCSPSSPTNCKMQMHRYCTTNGSNTLSTGAIVGIVIGALVVLACLVAIPMFFCAGAAGLCCAGCRRRQQAKDQTVVTHTGVHIDTQQQTASYNYNTGMPQQQYQQPLYQPPPMHSNTATQMNYNPSAPRF
ncbi:MAG: hypothetical protein MHM6MM_000783 [Cercozoa sp. M6MM]